MDYYRISAEQYRENVPDFRDEKFKRKKTVKLLSAQSSSESESKGEQSKEEYQSLGEEEDKHRVALTLKPEINQAVGKTLQDLRPEMSDIVSDEIPVTANTGVKESPVLPLQQPSQQPDRNQQGLLKSSESKKGDVSKEMHPGPSSIPKIIFSKPFKNPKKDFGQEMTEIEAIHEQMEKMRKEMTKLESAAKDEQRK